MDIQSFFISLLNVVCEMAPYLLLGFFIAGVLHVFVPQRFYANYLSRNNKLSVVWAALLGVPLPLCSCGVIPTAIGLKNEKASKGAIARPPSSVPLRKCLALRKPRPVLLPTPSPSKALPQKRPYVLPLRVSAIRLKERLDMINQSLDLIYRSFAPNKQNGAR